jgi:tetratricopeptide (TPR) repeat protein
MAVKAVFAAKSLENSDAKVTDSQVSAVPADTCVIDRIAESPNLREERESKHDEIAKLMIRASILMKHVFHDESTKDIVIENLAKALMIALEIEDLVRTSGVLEVLGRFLMDTGAPEPALKFFEQRLQIAHELGQPEWEAAALWSSAQAHEQLGDRQSATQKARQALALLKDFPNENVEYINLWLKSIEVP